MNPKRSYLYGAHVIVTGASDGIGKEIVRLLVGRFNCTVLGIARGEEKLTALKTELGGNFRYIVGDVTDVGLWKNISADFDRDPCSVLINNAGIMPPFTLALGEPDEELRRVFEVNYFAPVTATRMLLPKMKRVCAMPAVVNVCSSSALSRLPQRARIPRRSPRSKRSQKPSPPRKKARLSFAACLRGLLKRRFSENRTDFSTRKK